MRSRARSCARCWRRSASANSFTRLRYDADPETETTMSGPLTGIRILEFAGIGPGPFTAMMLSDMGAELLRIDRAGAVSTPIPSGPHWDIMQRGRRSVALDLKHPDAVAAALRMIERADALIEGF